MKDIIKQALASLLTLSSNGTARKLNFKKVPGKGFSLSINPATVEPQDVRTSLEAIGWGMIFNGEPSLYNGKIQSPSITIGPIECLGASQSTSDLDDCMDFID